MNYRLRYILLFTFISYFLAFFLKRFPLSKRSILGNHIPNPFTFIVPSILFVLFSGLRTFAGDTFYYIYSFDLIPADAPFPGFKFEGNRMFEIMQWYIKMRTNDSQDFIMVCAILSLVPALFVLYKYSASYELALYLFVMTCYFTLSMNAMRQYIAAGILLLGAKYMLGSGKSNFVKFSIIALMAFLFHSSALCMIPIYIVVHRKAWSTMTIAIIAGAIIGTMTFSSFLAPFLGLIENTDYGIYSETGWFTSGVETGSNLIRVFVMFVPVVMSYYAREKLKILGKRGDILVNLAVVNASIYIVSLYNWIFARFAVYLGIYFIILLVWLIENGFRQRDSRIIYFLAMGMFYYYFNNMTYTYIDYMSKTFKP